MSRARIHNAVVLVHLTRPHTHKTPHGARQDGARATYISIAAVHLVVVTLLLAFSILLLSLPGFPSGQRAQRRSGFWPPRQRTQRGRRQRLQALQSMVEEPDVASPPTAAAAAPAEAGTSETPPLTTQVYAADPSANLFEGRLYVYCSHDSPKLIEGLEVPHFNMEDYVVLSLDARGGGPPVVHDQVLKLADVPWAASKLWAPDAAEKNGTYFLYFPAQAPPPITEPPVPDPRSRLRRVRPVRPALAGPSGHLPARRGDSCAARGAVRRAAAADGGELLDRPRGLLRRRARRWALPLLRRHLGRAAAAVGGRHLRRVGRARRLGWEEASPRGGACHALLLPTVERRCSGPARPRAAA